MNEALLRILIVDDDEINRIIVEKILSRHFSNLEFAANGAEAYEKVLSQEIDIVLMDVHMPVMDGVEAVIKIRSHEEDYFKNLPIIAFTASILADDIEIVLQNGFNDYLPKPLKIDELIVKIREHINIIAINKKKRNSEELRLF